MHDIDQFFGGANAWVLMIGQWTDDVFANVVFNDFGDEAIERSRHEVACCRTSAQS